METIDNLDPNTVDNLKSLVRINIDSAQGFRTAADQIDDDSLQSFFATQGAERDEFAKSLATYLKFDADDAPESGSIKGKVHHWWIEAKGALQGGDRKAVLNEAERGEKHIQEAYEDALRDTAGSPVNDVLQRQHASIKASHDQIHELSATAG